MSAARLTNDGVGASIRLGYAASQTLQLRADITAIQLHVYTHTGRAEYLCRFQQVEAGDAVKRRVQYRRMTAARTCRGIPAPWIPRSVRPPVLRERSGCLSCVSCVHFVGLVVYVTCNTLITHKVNLIPL